jgi:hypothetical protein
MAEIFIPVLHWFDAGNIFTGSCGDFRFRIRPNIVKLTPKEVDFEKSSITAEFWHGPFCYEKSHIEGSFDFPMSEEGRCALKAWLESKI